MQAKFTRRHNAKRKAWKLAFLFVLFTGTCLPLKAGYIPAERAGKAGISFIFERSRQAVPLDQIRITETFSFPENSAPAYYIFNLSPDGFVAVAADDRVKPVLAYSFTGSFSKENQAPQFGPWMDQYVRQIRYAVENDIPAPQAVTAEWERLESGDSGRLNILDGDRDVEPMTYSTWNQNNPYNMACPEDAGGPGGHAYAGCVPTAMGQLMYYYRWPDTGTGSYSYEDPPYGTLSVNYDSATYDWNAMMNAATAESAGEIAKLLYHLGVACDLQYGPDGSGMYNHKSAYAWRTFFKYSPETQYVFRDSTTMSWDSILVAHLERKMPMYYAGWSEPNIVGHAFVCDGHQGGDYFHFNFGWGGSSDGYYYTGNLTPGGNNFNLAQEVIINCHPDTLNYSYPPYCTGNHILKTLKGSLEDGSGPRNNYQPNSSCSWLIDPQTDDDSVSNITLTFHRFSTNTGDIVSVYDGETTSAPLLGSFSGSTVPAALTGTSNKMLVTFTSGPGPASEGWFATWSATTPVWCVGIKTITADTAVITDGSYRFNYRNNTSCRWKIYNTTGNPLTLNFRSFDTEANNDFLRIYDLGTMDTLATLSGHYDTTSLPPQLTSQSGAFLLIFTTNSSITGKGWEIYYPKSTESIPSEGNIRGMSVYPNPASDRITVAWYSPVAEDADLSIWTAGGQKAISGSWDYPSGKVTRTLDVSSLQSGFYLLEIKTKTSLARHKLIINQH